MTSHEPEVDLVAFQMRREQSGLVPREAPLMLEYRGKLRHCRHMVRYAPSSFQSPLPRHGIRRRFAPPAAPVVKRRMVNENGAIFGRNGRQLTFTYADDAAVAVQFGGEPGGPEGQFQAGTIDSWYQLLNELGPVHTSMGDLHLKRLDDVARLSLLKEGIKIWGDDFDYQDVRAGVAFTRGGG